MKQAVTVVISKQEHHQHQVFIFWRRTTLYRKIMGLRAFILLVVILSWKNSFCKAFQSEVEQRFYYLGQVIHEHGVRFCIAKRGYKSSYYISKSPADYEMARQSCASYFGTHADILSINSDRELKLLNLLLSKNEFANTTSEVWNISNFQDPSSSKLFICELEEPITNLKYVGYYNVSRDTDEDETVCVHCQQLEEAYAVAEESCKNSQEGCVLCDVTGFPVELLEASAELLTDGSRGLTSATAWNAGKCCEEDSTCTTEAGKIPTALCDGRIENPLVKVALVFTIPPDGKYNVITELASNLHKSFCCCKGSQ